MRVEAIPMMAPRSMVQIDDVNFFSLPAEDAAASPNGIIEVFKHKAFG